MSSVVFKPYRALGLYSGAVPHIIRHHPNHKEYYITVAVGYVFHTYKLSNLGIVAVSDTLEANITALCANNKYIFASASSFVYRFSRGRHKTKQYCGHGALITSLLDFGSSPQMASADCEGTVKLWDVETAECKFSLSFNNTDFSLTYMMHPVGYTNKLLFGSRQGSLQLWNLRKNEQLYTITFDSAITCVAQAPAQDVCAVGMVNGRIVLHNILYDKTIMSFQQDGGAVTSISFRTDCKPEIVMVTGNSSGHLHLWALSECRVLGDTQGHMAPIAGVFCVPGHSYMITNAGDNALKVWHFDRPDGLPQVLHSRMGHWEPPNQLAFWRTLEATQLISAGKDSTIRVFSTIHDKHNRSLGRAYQPHVKRKKAKADSANLQQYVLPHVSHLTCQEARSGDWDTICATHRGIRQVSTWNFSKGCRGKHWLQPAEFVNNEAEHKFTVAECLDMTSCGNFVVVGYSSGHVFKFNVQSGLERGSYGESIAHSESVSGVLVNNVNKVVISTAGSVVKFWNFRTHAFIYLMHTSAPIVLTKLHRESDTLVLGLKTGGILLVDAMNRHIVRKFLGHRSTIRDITFSADAKLIISTGEDCLIKVWDVISAKLVDCFRVKTPVTSLSMSPVSDFLATTHENELGIYLWTNRGLYKHLILTPLDDAYEPSDDKIADMPTTVVRLRLGQESLQEEEMDTEDAQYVSPSQLQDRLITFSSFPASFWTTLINLKSIKERNKPKEPLSVARDAPFFLPTIETDKGLSIAPKEAAVGINDESEIPSKKVKLGNELGFSTLSALSPLLLRASQTKNYNTCIEAIMKLGPSAIDLEISLLAPSDGGSVELSSSFIDLLQCEVDCGRNVDLVQALSIVFYRKHCDGMLLSVPDVREKYQTLVLALLKRSETMQLKIDRSLAMIHFIRNTPYFV